MPEPIIAGRALGVKHKLSGYVLLCAAALCFGYLFLVAIRVL